MVKFGRPMDAFGALILGIICQVAGEQLPCQEYQGPENKTCILKNNLPKPEDARSWTLEWDGDVIVPAGQSQVLFVGFLQLNVSGLITFDTDSSFTSIGYIWITARGFRFNNGKLKAKNLTLMGLGDQGVYGTATLEGTFKIAVACPYGTVNVTGESVFYVHSFRTSRVTLQIMGKNVYLEDTQTQLKSWNVQLVALNELRARAEPLVRSMLFVQAEKVMLGWKGGNWILNSLTVVGQSVEFSPDHRLEVQYQRTCDNRPILFQDPCEEFLSNKAYHNGIRRIPESLDNLSVDLAILSDGPLDIGTRVRLVAGAPFLCSGTTLMVHQMAVLSSDARGCRAGQGQGRGETRPYFLNCGAAGGSSLGRGGKGASLRTSGLGACAEPGLRTKHSWSQYLPMTGAAGGGCAVPQRDCAEIVTALPHPVSSGGGLVWMSASSVILYDGVRITASGADGGMLNYFPYMVASGGGAGGQIIAISTKFEARCGADIVGAAPSECQPPKLMARGGNAQCYAKSLAVGGAGGGGFIGLQRNSTSIEEIELDVSGGSLTSSCADALPQKGRNLILGSAGIATSLVPCQEGHAGPFCSPCPVGSWGDGENACVPCTNKEGFAFYSADAWPNSSCLYECDLGLPDVKINPKCLNNIDFAMSFFGGRMGFGATLACPLLLFIVAKGIRWLHRKCRGMRGGVGISRRHADQRLGHFQVEKLPKHVCRIYWQGTNCKENPWKICDAEVLISSLPPSLASAAAAKQRAWEEFVVELRQTVQVPCWEPWCLFLVWLVSLPMYQLLFTFLRVRRANRVARRCSQSSASISLWSTSGAVASSGSHELCFRCDAAATSAHLDIFDLRRSLVDWAPARAEQLFVAQGFGTWEAPFELNVADPSLLGLAQTPESMAAQAVYSLVCTFNLFSRLVPPSELSDAYLGAEPPALALLDQEVRRCSIRLGHAAQVQVLRFVAPAPREKAAEAVEVRRASFSELVRRIPAADNRTEASTTTAVDWKLCLVFPHANSGYSLELVRHVGVLVAPVQPGDGVVEQRQAPFRSHTLDLNSELVSSQSEVGSLSTASILPLKDHHDTNRVILCEWLWRRVELLKFQMLSPWVCSIQHPILAFLVSVLFLTLILLDGMVCALVAYSLWRLCGKCAFWLWLLLPTPLAPALSTFLGVASVLMHLQSWVHSQLAWRSCFNVCLVGLPLLLQADVKAQLLPCLSLFLNLATSYAAAVCCSLEASDRDLAIAEDSGNGSLRGQVQCEAKHDRSRGQERSEVAMMVLPSDRSRDPHDTGSSMAHLRGRLSTFESLASGNTTASPMTPF